MTPFITTLIAYGIITTLLWGTALKLLAASWNLRR